MKELRVWDFLTEFEEALSKQLESDERRWGNTWLERTREGQEERVESRINDYFTDYRKNGTPVPWLKIIGNALISWIRENHPEIWEK